MDNPTISTLLGAIESSLTGLKECYILIDALDECSERNSLMRTIAQLASLFPIKILATSRKEHDIESELQHKATIAVCIESSVVDTDIGVHIRSALQKPQYQKWSDELKDEIEAKLMTGAQGM